MLFICTIWFFFWHILTYLFYPLIARNLLHLSQNTHCSTLYYYFISLVYCSVNHIYTIAPKGNIWGAFCISFVNIKAVVGRMKISPWALPHLSIYCLISLHQPWMCTLCVSPSWRLIISIFSPLHTKLRLHSTVLGPKTEDTTQSHTKSSPSYLASDSFYISNHLWISLKYCYP